MLTCLFPKETTPSRSTEIPFYFAPIKFHERKNDSNPLSLVQASGFPLHRHGYTVVIKLKGSAISLPRLPSPKYRTESGYILKGPSDNMSAFFSRHAFDSHGYTNRMSNRGHPVRRTEKTDPSVQTLSTRIVRISTPLGPFSPIPRFENPPFAPSFLRYFRRDRGNQTGDKISSFRLRSSFFFLRAK